MLVVAVAVDVLGRRVVLVVPHVIARTRAAAAVHPLEVLELLELRFGAKHAAAQPAGVTARGVELRRERPLGQGALLV